MSILKTKGAMLNDLYQITMSYAYWKNGMADHQSVFHLFYRKAPFKGSYSVFCGLDLVVDLIDNFKFDDDDITWMRSLTGSDEKPLFEEDFLSYLKDFKLDVDIDALPEGTVAFPNTPMVRVKGNIIACQLLETPLLNTVNFDTLVATKAARICTAAKSSAVFEFGLRRAQAADAGMRASRAAWIAGCTGTSNILAAQMYGIPAKGTHAHSWIMSHDNELDAFLKYGMAMPGNCVLLVDTYDTEQGVKKAIEAGKEIEANGGTLMGIRLDSGDLLELSKISRKLLNQAGFKHTKIIASNDLDEYAIEDLKSKGARIDIYGVGTRLVTAFDQPALGGVYKLAAIRASEKDEWNYKLKLSNEIIKVSNPGIQQVRRYTVNGMFVGDVIYNETGAQGEMGVNLKTGLNEMLDGEIEELLQPIFRNGKQVYELKSLEETREYCQVQLASLRKELKAVIFPDTYKVFLDEELYRLKVDLISSLKN
jgi:nicotinate phosphoribosyltransferase